MKNFFLSAMLGMAATYAEAAIDVGKVIEVYTHPTGYMGFRLDVLPVQANNTNNCGVASNEWLGVDTAASSSIKAGIFTAKISGAPVVVVSSGGCFGSFMRVEALHIR